MHTFILQCLSLCAFVFLILLMNLRPFLNWLSVCVYDRESWRRQFLYMNWLLKSERRASGLNTPVLPPLWLTLQSSIASWWETSQTSPTCCIVKLSSPLSDDVTHVMCVCVAEAAQWCIAFVRARSKGIWGQPRPTAPSCWRDSEKPSCTQVLSHIFLTPLYQLDLD